MNKRDYLRKQGFTVGERGRFNAPMLTALRNAATEGIVFDEDLPKPKKEPKARKVVAAWPTMPEQKIIRKARDLIGYTADGNKVAFILCSACNYHMMYCECPSITAPSVVSYSDDPLVSVRS